ncbi:sulfotransferase 1C4-like [Copidosoma floridanum]|uniref:sulfotransferase 1C4-like n=1 Tax=Copidosoma floridanum TaxID=29053 RepID=UPI0006C9B6C1|nr:sulfotransferase 1C4-like [Copidosoma floridanum]
MEDELDKLLSKCLADGIPIKFVNYKGLWVPDTYAEIADAIENFEVRDDDVWVCTFPKTGTTWTQEMVWGISNDINSEAAKVNLGQRFPFIEFTGTTVTGWISLRKSKEELPDRITKSVEFASNLPSPRFLKTHLPFHLLPRQLRTGEKKNKIIYVSRNPKDTCISYYHHYKLLEGFIGNFDDFVKLFLGNKIIYAPFWDHVIGFWENRNNLDVLFLKYEDMKADLPSVIRKTANFLGKSLTDQKVRELEDHLSFASMKKNPALNLNHVAGIINEKKMFGTNFKAEGDFLRKGLVGQWKTEMSEELIKKFDDWTEEKLKNHPHLLKEFL